LKHNRRSLNRNVRLARQVEEAISLSLGASKSARLRELLVHSVIPSADGARWAVRLVLQRGASIDDLEQIYDALNSAKAWLRTEVAAEIHRKRAPDLELQLFPSWEAVP